MAGDHNCAHGNLEALSGEMHEKRPGGSERTGHPDIWENIPGRTQRQKVSGMLTEGQGGQDDCSLRSTVNGGWRGRKGPGRRDNKSTQITQLPMGKISVATSPQKVEECQ